MDVIAAEIEAGAGSMRVAAPVAHGWYVRLQPVERTVVGLEEVGRLRFYDEDGICIDGSIAGWCYLIEGTRTWLLPTSLVGELRVVTSTPRGIG